MISTSYVKHVLLAFFVSAIFVAYENFRGQEANYLIAVLATIFGVLFMSLVVIRLPVFRSYYRNKDLNANPAHFRLDNQKAALVMSFLVAGVTFTLCLFLFGVKDLVSPGFCAGIAASITSHYHEPH